MRVKQLQEERRIEEENRKWRERWVCLKQHAQDRNEREKDVHKQENYRIIKQHYMLSQIFQWKYPNGKASKHVLREDDEDDPLSYHNLCKAVKRERWETEE